MTRQRSRRRLAVTALGIVMGLWAIAADFCVELALVFIPFVLLLLIWERTEGVAAPQRTEASPPFPSTFPAAHLNQAPDAHDCVGSKDLASTKRKVIGFRGYR